eukprot:COSAG06_NODE_48610_length_330_cov_333.021645_1_plen_83_part_10
MKAATCSSSFAHTHRDSGIRCSMRGFYAEFLMHDGDLIETPRPPAGMLMLGCRTCDEDFCMQCVLEMPLLTMLDPPDEPPLQQ